MIGHRPLEVAEPREEAIVNRDVLRRDGRTGSIPEAIVNLRAATVCVGAVATYAWTMVV
jgi:hypothetical protein